MDCCDNLRQELEQNRPTFSMVWAGTTALAAFIAPGVGWVAGGASTLAALISENWTLITDMLDFTELPTPPEPILLEPVGLGTNIQNYLHNDPFVDTEWFLEVYANMDWHPNDEDWLKFHDAIESGELPFMLLSEEPLLTAQLVDTINQDGGLFDTVLTELQNRNQFDDALLLWDLAENPNLTTIYSELLKSEEVRPLIAELLFNVSDAAEDNPFDQAVGAALERAIVQLQEGEDNVITYAIQDAVINALTGSNEEDSFGNSITSALSIAVDEAIEGAVNRMMIMPVRAADLEPAPSNPIAQMRLDIDNVIATMVQKVDISVVDAKIAAVKHEAKMEADQIARSLVSIALQNLPQPECNCSCGKAASVVAATPNDLAGTGPN